MKILVKHSSFYNKNISCKKAQKKHSQKYKKHQKSFYMEFRVENINFDNKMKKRGRFFTDDQR
jgi:hypothetical protein